MAIILTIVGLAGLVGGGELFVRSATNLARQIGGGAAGIICFG